MATGRDKDRSATESVGKEFTLQLLGGFALAVAGQSLPRLRTRKDQWLLAILALAQGAAVRRDTLAQRLWPFPEHSTQQSARNLRKSLWNLRKALGPEAHRLREVENGSLALAVDGAQIDVVSFERALKRDTDAALQQAIQLYRGPLLPDCTEPWVVFERERYRQAFQSLLLRHAARTRSVGDVAASDALRRLAAALGPLPETPHAPPERAAPPRAPATSEPDRIPGNLPHPLNPLIGRDDLIHDLRTVLYQGLRLITLTGPGGVGKTRVSIRLADSLRDAFEHGVWFADLASLSDPERVPQSVAAALDLPEDVALSAQEMLAQRLGDRCLLLILDNCEHVTAACASLTRELLRRCPRLHIVATSRHTLGLSERTCAVPPLPTPLPETLPSPLDDAALARLATSPAVQLFVQRAASATDAFALTADNGASVASICHHLDGIPLALEMAAAWTGRRSVAQIDAGLRERFQLLDNGSSLALPRQRGLRALLDWSFELLSDPERTLLLRLAVFHGGWSTAAAEVVCADIALPPRAIGRLLTDLADKSLIAPSSSASDRTSRGRLLETVHAYARERLADRETAAQVDFDACCRRHTAYAANHSARIGEMLRTGAWADAMGQLRPDLDNFRAALDRCRAQRDDDMVVAFADVLGQLLFEAGLWSDFETIAHDVEEALTRRNQPDLQIRLLGLQGGLARRRGQEDVACALWERRLSLCEAIGDHYRRIDTQLDLAVQAQDTGDTQRARRLLGQIIDGAGALPNPDPFVVAHALQARVALDERDPDAAREHARQSESLLPHATRAATPLFVLPVLAKVAHACGDDGRAQALGWRAVCAARDADRVFDVAIALQALAPALEPLSSEAAGLACAAAAQIHARLNSRWKQRSADALERLLEAHAECDTPELRNISWQDAVSQLEAFLTLDNDPKAV